MGPCEWARSSWVRVNELVLRGSVWMSSFFTGPCEWARSTQDRVLRNSTYDAGGLLQEVPPDINVRQGRVEFHAVGEGAQAFTADLIGHQD